MKPAATMPTYIGKEIVKVWRRAVMEVNVEWPMLLDKWKFLFGGLVFQYIHGIGARSAHFLHQPRELLHDIGFELLPELGKKNSFWSEYLFIVIFLPFLVWTFHPFVLHQKRFYCVQLWTKVLVVLCICQFLRMVSFTATQLPGPNYHCRVGSPIASLPPLKKIEDLVVLNLRSAGMLGCGDLIFSSHMTFTLTFLMTYTKYGTLRFIKFVGWLLLIVQSLLIVASRKHYTVDIVVAWYAVPLVFFFVDQYLAESVGQGDPLDPRDRVSERSVSVPLLPVKVEHRNEHSIWMNNTPMNGMTRPQGMDFGRQRAAAAPGVVKHGEEASQQLDGD